MRAKKRLGQHFLTNRQILDRIVTALNPEPGDDVLEIGPGRGALTERLLLRKARVTAIEKDHDLLARLRDTLPQVRVAHGDALDLDWYAIAGVHPSRLLVIGNIPFNITSPLLAKALTPPRPRRIVFLVQKEVADRLAAPPGGKTYGALTVGVQAAASVEQLFTVPAGAFLPPPKVDSAVVRLTPLATPLVPDAETRQFRTLVVGLFGQRRKQLQRSIRGLTGWSVEATTRLLHGVGIGLTARPETLAVRDFIALHRAIVDGIHEER